MKKAVSLLLTLLMLLSLLTTTVYAAGTLSVEVTPPAGKTLATLQAGDVVNVTVKLPAVAATRKMQFDLDFNDTYFTYNNDGAAPSILGKLTIGKVELSGTNKVRLVAAGTSNTTFTAGTVALTASFTVKSDVYGTISTFGISGLNTADSTVTAPTGGVSITIPAPPVPATKITLNHTSLNLDTKSADVQLTATLTPADSTDTVTWASSNTSVVTVSSDTGVVHVVGAGDAVITARANATVKAECKVHVASCNHTGSRKQVPEKAATCTVDGEKEHWVCENCGAKFMGEHDTTIATADQLRIPALNHDFTKKVKSDATLKTAGNCMHEAVYYYSCSRSGCTAIATDATLTFKGDKDATKHTGNNTYASIGNGKHKVTCECGVVIQAEEACSGGKAATCIAKSVCAKCGVEYGEFAAHKYATTWSSDGTHHWHACTVEGCNEKTDGAVHSSSGKNIATCQHGNICDICGYDDKTPVAHKAAANAGYASDATNHWQLCKWCGEKVGVTAHNFDHNGKCITCGAFNKDGKVMDHKHTMDRNSKMMYDANKHWYTCSDPACAGHADEAAHNFTTTTETINGKKYEVKTCACGYVTRVEVKNNTTGTTIGTNPNAKNPYEKNDTTKKDNGKKVESGKTFDAGIALYVGLSVLSVTGGALVIGKKKEF